MSILLARELGPSSRGQLAALQSLVAIVTVLAPIGVPKAAVFWFASTRGEPYLRLSRIMMKWAIGSAIVAGVTYSATLMILSVERRPVVVGLAVVLAIGTLVSTFLEAPVRAARLHSRVVASSLATVLVPVAIVGALALLGSLTVGGVIGARAVAAIAASTLLVRPVRRSLSKKSTETSSGEPPRSKLLAVAGLQHMAVAACLTLTLDADLFFLRTLRSAKETGLYAVAASLSEIGLAIPAAASFVLYPLVASAPESGPAVAATSTRLAVTAGLFALVPISLGAHLIIPAAYGISFEQAADVVPGLSLAVFLSLPFYTLTPVLQGLGKRQSVALLAGVALASNLILNALLTPRFGMAGAAFASIISYAMLGLGSSMVAAREFDLRGRDLWIARWSDVQQLMRRPIA